MPIKETSIMGSNSDSKRYANVIVDGVVVADVIGSNVLVDVF